ncbi:hypothetical protein EF405_03740 [Cyclobacteriaceae bacterium YHN15]|nr:hypothetical protein EF405_03740 [Cyclobacteriaceae bacterium YHN15]
MAQVNGFHIAPIFSKLALSITLIVLFPGIFMESYGQLLEKYGQVGFVPPAQWSRNSGDGYLAFTKINQESGEFGRIILYQEEKSSGSLDVDFKEDWQSLIEANYQPKDLTDFSKTSFNSEWNAIIGVAPFVYQNQNQAVVLVTLSNRKQKISYVFLSNTTAYEKELEDFGSSLEFSFSHPTAISSGEKPISNSSPTQVVIDQQILGKWNRSASVSPFFSNPAAWGSSGYTTCRYEFFQDGTYHYTERNFGYAYEDIILVRENGQYSADGGVLTITPIESQVERYGKKNGGDELGNLKEKKSRTLEKVAYRYKLHYFEGIGQWNLVLQADRPTQRDGNFSSNTTFPNAWYFDQRFTEVNLLK